MKHNNLKFLTLGLVAIPLMSGCNKGLGLLDSKTTITLEPFSASGYGIQYLKDVGNEWSKQYLNGKYTIHVKTSSTKNGVAQVGEIESNSTNTDVYFGGDPKYSKGFYKGYFEDLTDFVELEPDNDGVSIKDKIPNYDAWRKSASKLDWTSADSDPTYSGLYMIPFSRTFIGLVFDYQDFYEKGLLVFAKNDEATKLELDNQGITYETSGQRLVYTGNEETDYLKNGEFIASKGNDGLYGTYDDGQPQTYDEFSEQLTKIKLKYSTVAFASNPGDCYLQNLFEALFAQTAGAFGIVPQSLNNAVVSKDFPVFNVNSEKVTINWKNGYKAYQAKWMKESMDKVYDLFCKSKLETGYVTGAKVTNAQGAFVGGLEKEDKDHVCYLVEGNWWEKEAESRLTQIGAYGSGKFRDFRMMPMPSMDGGLGLDGNGHGKVYSAPECGAICIRKQSDPDKLAAIKDFLLYFLKNDTLAKITSNVGLFFGYNYTISEDLYSKMSPFVKYCYNVLKDEDNCKVLSRAVDMMAAPFSFTCGTEFHAGDDLFPLMEGPEVASVTKKLFLDQMDKSYDTSIIWEQIRGTYTENQWNEFVQTSLSQFNAWNRQ